MNLHMNEELMWERLKDIQREVENSRSLAQSRPRNFRPLQWIARLLTRRADVQPLDIAERPSASDAA